MELWVRSQDKEIIFKVKSMFYSTNEENEHFIRTIIVSDIHNGIVTLGQYSTKERALEVLDEIQYQIKNMYILENCKLPKKSCIERRLAMDNFNIYEMPID